MKIIIHQTAKVAGGYEYFYTITDDKDNVLAGNQFAYAGKLEPKETATEDWKTARLTQFTQELQDAETVPEDPEKERIITEFLDKSLADETIDKTTYDKLVIKKDSVIAEVRNG